MSNILQLLKNFSNYIPLKYRSLKNYAYFCIEKGKIPLCEL